MTTTRSTLPTPDATTDPRTYGTTVTSDPAADTGPDRTSPAGDLRLARLLRAAASTATGDPAWSDLTCDARAVTVALAGTGALPGHLVVGPHDPPALVTRLLVAAWRHATSAPVRDAWDRR